MIGADAARIGARRQFARRSHHRDVVRR